MKNNKKNMLITGVSGLLGCNLAYYFRDKFNVLGLYNTHLVEIDGMAANKADILLLDQLKNTVNDFIPDIIIHCASLTDVDYCEVNKINTDIVNVLGTKNVVDSLNSSNAKIIYISSDSVYEGVTGNYSETDSVHPQNYYGMSKYKGELEVLKRPNSLVLRTNIFGWNIQAKHSIAERILHELTGNRQINGFDDVYFSSIYTFDLARILEKAIEQNLAGIYNCGSRDSISKYDFARLIARLFHLNQNLVNPISIDDYKFKAKRGRNLSLNVSKLELALKRDLPGIDDTLEAFYDDFSSGIKKKLGREMPAGKITKPLLNYGKQSIDEDDIQAVVDVLRSTNLTQGPKIAEFEDALCRYTGARFAVACNSGTSALHMACMAAGVKEGNEVITSPITFVASANCAVYCGATPVFADIDSRTYNLLPNELEKKITANTTAIIPVHFAGQSCLMKDFLDVKQKAESQFGNRIYIIEDASHALGSIYKNTNVGSCSFSDMTVMSFHPVKHITTGEGGMVLTNDEFLYKRLKRLRSHGITNDPNDFVNADLAFQPLEDSSSQIPNPWYHEQQCLGYNYRLTDIQCALGISQLKKLDTFLRRRRKIVDRYNVAFKDTPHITTPFEHQDCRSNFHLYVLLFDFQSIRDDRAHFMLTLRERGIQTQVHYIPVHLQPFYQQNYHTKKGDCPHAEAYYEKCLSIPLYPAMTDDEVEMVIYEIKEMLS